MMPVPPAELKLPKTRQLVRIPADVQLEFVGFEA
jgi:hypothetical protein